MITEGNYLREILIEYRVFKGLLRQEQEAILKGRTKELESFLADGLNRIKAIEEKTKAFREGGKYDPSLPDAERTRSEIGQMLKELLTLSRQNEELMLEKWRKVGEEMERIRTGERLIRAYRPVRGKLIMQQRH